jgi:hypothetical protein
MNASRFGLYMQAVRGPLLLVTLGFLCTLHEADMLSFRYTWPVLIIMVGVLILIERAVAPPAPIPPNANPWAGYQKSSGWNQPQNPASQPGSYPSGAGSNPSGPSGPQPGGSR